MEQTPPQLTQAERLPIGVQLPIQVHEWYNELYNEVMQCISNDNVESPTIYLYQ